MQNKKVFKNLFKQLLNSIILTALLSGAFSVSAQTGGKGRITRKVQGNSQGIKKIPVVKGKDACQGGWSGVITYEQTLDESGGKDQGGGSFTKWSRNLSYEGKIIVDGSDPNAVATNSKLEFSDVRRQQEKVVMRGQCGAWRPEHDFIVDNRQNDTETGKGAGQLENFRLYFDDRAGTYDMSFRFPSVPGKWVRDAGTERSGQCQPKNNEPIDASDQKDTVITGEMGAVERQKINPAFPDVLTGSVTIDNNDKNRPDAVKLPITTISWKLRRCSPPLIITDLKFYHLRYPSPNTWEQILDDDYTIDGNDVKIVATVANLSGEQKSATVDFKELKENADLPEGKVSVTVPPREEREVEYIWDTSGYAWKEASPWNKSEIFRKIEARIPTDQMLKELEIHPKPVVVIPGLWSNSVAFAKLVSYFTPNKLDRWATATAPVDSSKIAADNAPVIDKTVRDIQKKENAWHIDLVAHSTGGLMARAYVDNRMPTQYNGRPTATHLVMLGTPNLGTPCAQGMDDVLTRIFSREPAALGELTLRNMRAFNESVKLRHGTKFSILVGNSVASTCQLDLPGDGITLPRSGIWAIKDWKFSTVAARHEEMPGEQANFMQVYKWLSVPPKGNHAPDNAQASIQSFKNGDSTALQNEDFGKSRNYGAMFRSTNLAENNFLQSVLQNDSETEPIFASGLKLAPKGASEMEIAVTNGSRFSLILYAAPNVSAVLVDEKGEIIGKSLANETDSFAAFRSININKPFQNGKWKLRLESRAETETEVLVTAFVDYDAAIFREK